MARRPLAYALIAAGAALLSASAAIPLLLVPQLTVLPLDLREHSATEPGPAQVLDAVALEQGRPVAERASDPECAGASDTAPLSCFIHDGVEVVASRAISTQAPSDARQITLEAIAQLRSTAAGDDGDERADGTLATTVDRVTLERSTAFPVPDPVSTVEYSTEHSTGSTTEAFTRTGYQYRFPVGTDKKSYPFFDTAALRSTAIDFADEEDIDGRVVYRYEQRVGPVNLVAVHGGSDGGSNAPLQLSLAAGRWGTGESGSESVTMDCYYTVHRVLRIEPTSGIVVDSSEEVHLFYARDPEEAEELAGSPDGDPVADRTVLRYTGQWDRPTRERQLDAALEVSQRLDLLRTWVPWTVGTVGVIAVVAGGAAVAGWTRRPADGGTVRL